MTVNAARRIGVGRWLRIAVLGAALVMPGIYDTALAAEDADQIYSDHTWHFQIHLPPGWAVVAAPRPGEPETIRAHFKGPQASHNGQSCNITVMDAPTTASLSQAEINSAYDQGAVAAQPITEIRSSDPNAAIVNHSIVSLNGRSTQITDITMKVSVGGLTGDMELYTLIFTVPGRTYIGNCTAKAPSYDALRPGFDAMMRTLNVIAE
jgi:hypothetical protein